MTKIDSASCQSSDSGHFSDNDNTTDQLNTNTSLDKLLRKGLHLVSNVNQKLDNEKETKDKDNEELSSRICGNSNKVIIKIGNNVSDTDNGHVIPSSQDSNVVSTRTRDPGSIVNVDSRLRLLADREIATDSSGTISVPVPYNIVTTV